MGLDLTLMTTPWSQDHPLLHTMMALDRNRELFDEIRALPAERLEGEAALYRDEGVEDRTTDAYGGPLTWVRPWELSALLENYQRKHPDRVTPWNAAVFAFVRALPPDRHIYLYWN